MQACPTMAASLVWSEIPCAWPGGDIIDPDHVPGLQRGKVRDRGSGVFSAHTNSNLKEGGTRAPGGPSYGGLAFQQEVLLMVQTAWSPRRQHDALRYSPWSQQQDAELLLLQGSTERASLLPLPQCNQHKLGAQSRLGLVLVCEEFRAPSLH